MKNIHIIIICATLLIAVTIRTTYPFHEGFLSGSLVVGQFMRNNSVVLPVELEVSQTPQQIEQGLMHRNTLAPNTGMLFVFSDEQKRAFWMRNTRVPLDMFFITSAGHITNIHPSVPPYSEELRSSTAPVQYVVELPGGTAEKYGIIAGDSFVWKAHG